MTRVDQSKDKRPNLFMAITSIFATAPRNEITRKRPKPRKSISGIDVMLDHIKSKVIKPAETPHRYTQQNRHLDVGMLHQQQAGRNQSNHQEQKPFKLYPARTRDVSHDSLATLNFFLCSRINFLDTPTAVQCHTFCMTDCISITPTAVRGGLSFSNMASAPT